MFGSKLAGPPLRCSLCAFQLRWHKKSTQLRLVSGALWGNIGMRYKYIFMVLWFFSPAASAEIYKCQSSNGKLTFSDKPCPSESSQETISLKEEAWTTRLKRQKPPSINIVDIISKDGETTIKYKFKTIADSTAFLRQTGKLSNMPVVLLKILQPKGESMGRAEIKASNKPNPLIDKLKKRSVDKHPITSQNSNATSWLDALTRAAV